MDVPEAVKVAIPVVMTLVVGGKFIKYKLMASSSNGGYYLKQGSKDGKVKFFGNKSTRRNYDR
jgi:hypothetical protein